MSRSLPLVCVACLLLGSPAAALAQQLQLGWAISSSQGRGTFSAASQEIRATAADPGPLLINAIRTAQPDVYRALDPSQQFQVLESSETSITTTNSNNAGFSSFSGSGLSLFHLPLNP